MNFGSVVGLFLLVLVMAMRASAAEQPPHLVVFLADDFSQLDATPFGGSGIRTPEIAKLASEGMTFNRAYVASPSCAPSRAALLTGLMPARNGAEANHSKPRAELKKWPAYFQEQGYEVVAFGKVSHYRHTADYGFDYFAHDSFHDHASIPAAVAYLRDRPPTAKPLCLMVGSNWPHVPWPQEPSASRPDALRLPAGSIDTPATRHWRARYAAAVDKLEDELRIIRHAVHEHLGSNTLFLFTSDHGAQWPFAKWNCYESGICVPLIVSWPGVTTPGSRSEALISWVDLLPTLYAVSGGQPPPSLDGQSFLPVLKRQKATHRDRVFATHSNDGRMNVYPARSVRDERWKYIRNLHPEFAFTTHIDLVGGELGQRAFFSTWERAAEADPAAAEILRRYHARPAEELYDLQKDPDEQNNLAADPGHAEHLARLRGELDQWMETQGDRQVVLAEPRLLSDRDSYGPRAAVESTGDSRKKKK
ncbi:MAG: sulfatase [Pirellulaceae bacterium]